MRKQGDAAAHADIVIVGAGAAGIGAARRLAAADFSVLVLEAMARPGGRAWTQEAAGVPLDLGCGWLHSGDRNPWTRIAEHAGFTVDRGPVAWGTQYHDLGFPPAERAAARQAFARWSERLVTMPPASDRAADALEPDGAWTAYLQARSGFISGDELERISVADYTAYDLASTGCNWRVPAGYGALITSSLPRQVKLRLSTPVRAIGLDGRGVTLETPAGTIRSWAAIILSRPRCSPATRSPGRRRSIRGGTPPAACLSATTRSCSLRSSAAAHLRLKAMCWAIRGILRPVPTTFARSAGRSSSVTWAVSERERRPQTGRGPHSRAQSTSSSDSSVRRHAATSSHSWPPTGRGRARWVALIAMRCRSRRPRGASWLPRSTIGCSSPVKRPT